MYFFHHTATAVRQLGGSAWVGAMPDACVPHRAYPVWSWHCQPGLTLPGGIWDPSRGAKDAQRKRARPQNMSLKTERYLSRGFMNHRWGCSCSGGNALRPIVKRCSFKELPGVNVSVNREKLLNES